MQPPYHPLVVHFPIALYFLGVLMTLGYLWRKEPAFEQFAYWAFFLSWLAAIVASLVGLVDKGQLPFDDPRQGAMNRHITLAILFIVLDGLVVYHRFRWPDVLSSPRRWVYFGLLAAAMVAITITGWLGGELVYGLHIGIR
ncbi:MAG: DUF2231 domain-containing protein [Caldilineae bacterium]|nr:MAG: DUF2231 domain-containing protein [Caldilineae bacterium]